MSPPTTESSAARLHLAAGHVKPIWAGHPWVYAQAIARCEGQPAAGDVVDVLDAEQRFLGRGFYSPDSAIPVRILSREADESLDEAAFARRIHRAVARRKSLGLPSGATNGYRLIHAEGDQLPGLIVDRYDRTLVVQLLTIGTYRRRESIYDLLASLEGIDSVVETASTTPKKHEGFTTEGGTVRGASIDQLRFHERSFEWQLPISLTQKTGFYFDQRENRALIERLASGRRVLDLCCYVGAFALAAARGGAEAVVAVDRSEALLDVAASQAQANGLADRIEVRTADVRRDLVPWAEAGARYDLVVLDPPKLSPTGKHRRRALGAYRNLNTAALRLVSPGGLLATCSCSAAITTSDLLRETAAAGQRLRRSLDLLELRHQGPDHPTPAAFDEGRYLDFALFQVR